MSILGCRQITRSTPPNPLPPLQPLANNIDGSGMQLVELASSFGGSNAFIDSFVNKFVALLPTANFGDSNGILNNTAPSTQLMVPLSSGGVFSMMVKRR
jgi:hypothetical protein